MSSTRMDVSAPAKINLFLEVRGRRPDGYHTLSTLFQEISLTDVLSARFDPSLPSDEFRLEIPGSPLSAGPDNLVLRAAREFTPLLSQLRPGESAPPSVPGVRFRLTKRIPMGAGLGGGSSDAAATLKALWRLHGGSLKNFPLRQAARAARRLGADVPFFLQGGRAKAGGIGDRLTPLPAPGNAPAWFVLVFPRVFVSTPVVFKGLRFPLTKRRSSLKLERMLKEGRPAREWADLLFNRLEEVVFPRFPAVREAHDALAQAGCRKALMSGSGSSVFGVVDAPAQGRRVMGRLPRGEWDAWLVRSA